ncbi:hypothetical protein [Mycobacterium sp. IDR2000157661]|uniref:hypothetical protein n=1 Tax=Mycobacterium sp. IDR2000157661 TaxID=2867005 RepID=UPI001EECDDF2|nr:hypothetical protein [Mycobacterium sp. IDR2000157661]ULE31580.1 hypothetical protein K3G64_15310 [Mycobacterium sp. IDR2000157661]
MAIPTDLWLAGAPESAVEDGCDVDSGSGLTPDVCVGLSNCSEPAGMACGVLAAVGGIEESTSSSWSASLSGFSGGSDAFGGAAAVGPSSGEETGVGEAPDVSLGAYGLGRPPVVVDDSVPVAAPEPVEAADGESELDTPGSPVGSASTMPGCVATDTPTPSATAKTPTRPMYPAYDIRLTPY